MVRKTNPATDEPESCLLMSEWPELFPRNSPEIRVITVWQLCNYAGREWMTRLRRDKRQRRQLSWGSAARETAFLWLSGPLTKSLLSVAVSV